MAKRKDDSDSGWERSRSSSRLAGALLLATLLALVGWSFNATLEHEKKIPVLELRVSTNEDEIKILRGE